MRIDDRGMSEVVGYVLLVGMVVGGMSVVLLAGGTAVQDLRERSTGESASLGMGEFDARVSSLATGGVDRTEVRFPRRQVNSMEVIENGSPGAGSVRIDVNAGACSATIPMSTVRYELDGEVVGYQAGGLWRTSPGSDSSAMATPPDFDFEAGTLDAKVVNLSGRIAERRVSVYKDVDLSTRQTDAVEEELFNGSAACRRPDNVTVVLDSRFHDGWSRHVENEVSELPASERSVTVSGGQVTLRLEQNALPDAANDSRNDVVRFYDGSGSPPSTDGAFVPVYNESDRTEIAVDKAKLRDGNNNYTMTVRPLANGSQVSFPDSRDADDAVFRTPLDVVFVIDESGSMGWNANPDAPGCDAREADGGCFKKYQAARTAATGFIGNLNASIDDRVSVVGFDTGSRNLLTNGNRFSSDYLAVNSTINNTPGTGAGGGTRADRGMRQGLDNVGFEGNSSHQKVMIVLSDGRNDDPSVANRNMIRRADRAEQNGITVYTVGFGDSSYLNETVLRLTATTTGGTYYNAENSSELTNAFDSIFANISSSSVIVNEPVQFNMSVSGSSSTVEASVGDGDDAARIGGGYNANDPSAASFDISTNVDDGNVTNLTAYRYDCREYRTTNIVRRNATIDEERVEIRCVDHDPDSRQRIPVSDKDIYLDGDSAGPVLSKPTPWWEGNLSRSLDGYLNDSTGEFELGSNRAIVTYRFGTYTYNGTVYHKRMIMLYEVGVSNEFRASDVVDVEVVSAEIRDD